MKSIFTYLELVRGLHFGLLLPNFVLNYVVLQSRSYGYLPAGRQGVPSSRLVQHKIRRRSLQKQNPNKLLTAAWILITLAPLTGQAPLVETSESLFDQFYSEEHDIQEIIIKTDVKTLLKKRAVENYQPADISYYDRQGVLKTSQIKIRARGVTRKEICDYPPLKLKFKKAELKVANLNTFNKLKLVNQVNGSPKSGHYIYKEYLAYRLYNLISPYSLRVQLIKTTYQDTKTQKKDYTSYGLLIEPIEELAARINARVYEPKNATSKSTFMEKLPYKTMSVFQYMIGNTDWSVGNIHNLKLVKVEHLPRLVPIPYDFDYAGIVNAYYAVPHESLTIKSVTERQYRGKAWTDEEREEITALFLAKKEAIFALCEQFPHLNNIDRKHTLGYLSTFFKIMEHPKRSQNVFGRR